MLRYLICFCLLFSSHSIALSNPEVDSLKTLLNKTSNVEKKLDLYIQIIKSNDDQNVEKLRAEALKIANNLNDSILIFTIEFYSSESFLFNQQFELAKKTADKCHKIAQYLNIDSLKIKSTYNLALYHAFTGENKVALDYFEKITNDIDNHDLSDEFKLNFYGNSGRTYLNLQNYKQALNQFNEALYLSLYKNNHKNTSLIYFYFAAILRINRDFKKTIHFLEKSAEFRELAKLPPDPFIQENLGITYMELGLYKKAVIVFNTAINGFKEKLLHNKEDAINVSHKEVKYSIAKCNLNLAEAYLKLKQTNKAVTIYNNLLKQKLEYNQLAAASIGLAKCNYYSKNLTYKKSYFDSIISKEKDAYKKHKLIWNISNYYIDIKDYKSAITFLNHIVEQSEKNYSYEIYYGNSLIQLSHVYSEIGDYKNAYLYNGKFIKLSDSLREQSNYIYTQTQGLVEKAIADQHQKDNSIAQQKITLLKNSKVILIISLFALSTVVFLIGYFIRNIYKQKMIKEQVTTEMKVNKIESLIEGEELQKKEISHFVHEKLSQDLISAKYSLNNVKTEDFDSEKQKTLTKKHLDSSIKKLREISYDLSPPTLDFMNIDDILESYCEEVSNIHPISIKFEHSGDRITLEKKMQLAIYRIVQELINNIVQHSKSNNKKAFVRLFSKNNTIKLTVTENGISNHQEWKEGFGWKKIKYRMSLLNATHKINTNANGTSVLIEMNFSS